MTAEAIVETPLLSIRNLSVRLPNGRVLLRDSELDVARGEFVLLVGPSGSGKSTLLKYIAGVLEQEGGPTITGDVLQSGETPSDTKRNVGLVFQDHALFDEMTAEANVRFALDHAAERDGGRDGYARELLASLGVPAGTHLSRLSGGERQRVAVARTLALDPPLLLFDEPTTGLDPVRARAVANLIRKTFERPGRSVVVVTHDYRPFMAFDPRAVVLDSTAQRLREIPAAELPDFFETIDVDDVPPDETDQATLTDLRLGIAAWVRAPGDALLALLLALWAVAGGWRRPQWKLRYLWHYSRIALFGSTAIFVALAGAMLGFVFTSFSFAQLPYTQITVPLLTEELLAATGYSTYRVIVPLLISVLIAGKCGATIAADVGSRRLTHQFEALRSFGARPEFYLFGSVALAMTVGAPLLNFLAYLCNTYAALIAFLMTSEDTSIAVFQKNFLATVWPSRLALPHGTGWVVLKSASSGLLVAVLAYVIGARRKLASPDVSRDVSLTIFWATIAVLFLHSLFSFVEF